MKMAGFHLSYSSYDTFLIGQELGRELLNGDVVLLSGNLGSGKTTFTKGIAKALGVSKEIISPTFNILREYEGTDSLLIHIDMYRIESEDELENTGIDEIFDCNSIIVIEWNKKNTCKHKRLIYVSFEINNDFSRRIWIDYE
ncbi:MAG: tRNA threonylcarbamoyladenosine biosynthesis protein TsaE [Firmicutes bacterium ADurb.Bin080]|jgi:tRNA threonylcarbamoyladenosine biosynthesis protein TsaE|nr:MAG: tRNA threonylcarbamoyladenosine biosynthesis protein TsaE [Firmicutes bacterium ADurb.Bin080]